MVEPTRSQNITVSCRRSPPSVADLDAGRGAPDVGVRSVRTGLGPARHLPRIERSPQPRLSTPTPIECKRLRQSRPGTDDPIATVSASDAEHQPMMSQERVRQVRAWHEANYESAEHTRGVTTTFMGRALVVPPEVHPPQGVSDMLANAVLAEVRTTDRVLDMGTGAASTPFSRRRSRRMWSRST